MIREDRHAVKMEKPKKVKREKGFYERNLPLGTAVLLGMSAYAAFALSNEAGQYIGKANDYIDNCLGNGTGFVVRHLGPTCSYNLSQMADKACDFLTNHPRVADAYLSSRVGFLAWLVLKPISRVMDKKVKRDLERRLSAEKAEPVEVKRVAFLRGY